MASRGTCGSFWYFPEGPQYDWTKYKKMVLPMVCLEQEHSCLLERGGNALAHWEAPGKIEKELVTTAAEVLTWDHLRPSHLRLCTDRPSLIHGNRYSKAEGCPLFPLWVTKKLLVQREQDNLLKMSPFLILDNRLFLLPAQPPTVTHILGMKKVEKNQQTYKKVSALCQKRI